MDRFLEARRIDEAFRVANALYRFWITKQRFAEGAAVFDRVLAAPEGDDLLRGKACLYAGMMPFWMGDDPRASELFNEALETGRRLGDARLTSQALGGLARVALRSDVPEARRLAGEALAVSEAADDEDGRSNALHMLGVGAQLAGDLLEARSWMTQRLALVRSTDNQFLIASEAANLSMVERQLGDLDAAEELAREALEIESRTGDQFTTPFALSGLASIAMERGQLERAATLVGAAEIDHGDPGDGLAARRATPLRKVAGDTARGDGAGRLRSSPSSRPGDVAPRRRRLCPRRHPLGGQAGAGVVSSSSARAGRVARTDPAMTSAKPIAIGTVNVSFSTNTPRTAATAGLI